MTRQAALLTIVGLLLAAQFAARPNARQQNLGLPLVRPLLREPREWPDLSGRVGPYGGIETVDGARKMVGDGLNMALLSSVPAGVLKTLREGGATYVDVRLWRLIDQVCKAQFALESAQHQPQSCALSEAEQAAIALQASAHLKQVQGDAGIVGFWILDDYPHGNITGMLQRLHQLVQQSNAESGNRRPTICGVGGRLDFKQNEQDPQFTQDWRYLDSALTNVSRGHCDIVSPYFYAIAPADNPRLIDWSMRDLLPYFRQALTAKSYGTAQVVLPIAHAFTYHAPDSVNYYVMPRPGDVATQMKAYCEGGAFSIMFFTWQSADATRSYVNDESLREGVLNGRSACLQTWANRD